MSAAFRHVIRVKRLLSNLGRPDDVIGALEELGELRELLAKLTPTQRAWLDAKGDPRSSA